MLINYQKYYKIKVCDINSYSNKIVLRNDCFLKSTRRENFVMLTHSLCVLVFLDIQRATYLDLSVLSLLKEWEKSTTVNLSSIE